MKRLFHLQLFLAVSFCINAQKKLPDFGKTDINDLLLKSCSFEPEANAMKLFDIEEVEYDPSEYVIRMKTERRVRIKIFNEQGYKHATIRIPYYYKRKTSKFKELKGIVYFLDDQGKIVTRKLESKDFFKEKAVENIGVINFTFPNLKPGCIVEFTYSKVEKDILHIEPWVVQAEIPVAYASRTVIVPSFARLKEKVFGEDSVEERSETLVRGVYKRDKKTFFKEHIRSFRPEPFMSSHKDNLLRMVFLLLPRSNFVIDALTSPDVVWKYVGMTLLESKLWGGQLIKPIPGTESIIDSAKKISSVPDRIGFLFDTVRKRFPDVAEQTLYPDDEVDEVWNSRSANTAEINLILLNLLRKSGVVCYPLLISTRENGKINPLFPSAGQLNGVDIVAVDKNTVYLIDASARFQSYKDPPFNVLNRQGFLLDPGNMKWLQINDDRPLVKQQLNIISQFNENGFLEGNASCQYYNYAKSYMLDTTDNDNNAEDRFFDKKFLGLKILSSNFENADKTDEALLQKIEFSYETQNTDNYYFINPQFLSLRKENPFLKEKRNFEIDFGCNQELTLTLHINIPATFRIDHLPTNIIVRAPDSSFFFKRRVYTDSAQIYLSQTFEIKRSVFDKEEYEGVKEFFDRVFGLMGEEIVLKKK